MINIGTVHGDAEQAVKLVVGTDTVYVHTNIIKTTTPDPVTGTLRDEYTYHEAQYGKDEYLKLLSEEKDGLDAQVTDLQLALIELYEGKVV